MCRHACALFDPLALFTIIAPCPIGRVNHVTTLLSSHHIFHHFLFKLRTNFPSFSAMFFANRVKSQNVVKSILSFISKIISFSFSFSHTFFVCYNLHFAFVHLFLLFSFVYHYGTSHLILFSSYPLFFRFVYHYHYRHLSIFISYTISLSVRDYQTRRVKQDKTNHNNRRRKIRTRRTKNDVPSRKTKQKKNKRKRNKRKKRNERKQEK